MRRSHAIAVVLLVVFPVAAQAQRSRPRADISRAPLNFGPPGARALGMGAAFVAVADDATASESNPAGLTILTKPEVSLHLRQSSYDVGFTNPFTGVASSPDESISSPSFASVVFPARIAVFSLYWAKFQNYRTPDFSVREVDTDFNDLLYYDETTETSQDNLGVSAAFRFGPVSVGASVRQTEQDLDQMASFRLDYFRDVYIEGEPTQFGQMGRLPDGQEFLDTLVFENAVDDSDSDITYNLGLLFNPTGTLSFGAVYKAGGEFEFSRIERVIDCASANVSEGAQNCTSSETLAGADVFEDAVTTRVDAPDLISAGIAWRPLQGLTIALDANYITYEDYSYRIVFFEDEPAFDDVYEFENAVELHIGLEYFLQRFPVALRIGAWHDPDRGPVVTYGQGPDEEPLVRDFGDPEPHVTIGTGFVIREDFQIDLAYDYSEVRQDAVASLVYRF